MPTSRFDAIMSNVGIPALLTAFGITATHVNADGDEVAVTIILEQQQDPLALAEPWPQRQWTVQVAKSVNPKPGDTFTIAGDVTDDDPYPDDTVWQADTVINDDGYLVTLAVRKL
jgi:hypothetical protein